MRKSTLQLGALGVAAITIASTGVAYAYWTTTGTGTGTATVGNTVTADAISITQSAAQAAALSGFYPGSSAQAIVVDVTNPAAFSQKVGNITVTVADKVTAAGTCLGTDWTVDDSTADSPSVGILAKNDGAAGGSDTKTGITVATLALKDTSANQDACKGVSPALTFTSAAGAL